MRKRVASLPVVVASAVGLNLTLAGQNEAGVVNQAGQAGEPSSVGCTVDQAPMRDGVKLATEVYLPADTGRFPAILQRTP